jgi:hypothetical protein
MEAILDNESLGRDTDNQPGSLVMALWWNSLTKMFREAGSLAVRLTRGRAYRIPTGN